MTPAEITAYVMALSAEELRRLSATDVMGWELATRTRYERELDEYIDYDVYTLDGKFKCDFKKWRPDIDRNQSRMMTDAVRTPNQSVVFDWLDLTPDQESRAALIAWMIHKEKE